LLKRHEFEPALCVKKGGELRLSGPALAELLRAVLDRGVPFRFRATGFSMSPFIRDGDVITVFPSSDAPARLGDVVAFVRPETGGVVIHRVVGKRDDSLLVTGDSSCATDDLALETVSEANILGRVTRVERHGRQVSLGLGAERFLIAFVTRRGLLSRLVLPVWKRIRPIVLFCRGEH
jgi:signal peptidase I